VRALILATLVATGFITVALAAGEKNSGVVVKPPAPQVTTPPAPPAPAPAPLVTAPPPAPPAIVEAPWPDNVPKIKPGTGGTPLIAARTAPAASAATAGEPACHNDPDPDRLAAGDPDPQRTAHESNASGLGHAGRQAAA
jgi:hypothetical protein